MLTGKSLDAGWYIAALAGDDDNDDDGGNESKSCLTR